MKKYLIDGSVKIIGYDDNEIPGHTVATTLHEMLWKNTTHDTLKCYDLGLGIKKNGKLELDESDFRFLEEVVSKCVAQAQFKGPVIRALHAARDGAKDNG